MISSLTLELPDEELLTLDLCFCHFSKGGFFEVVFLEIGSLICILKCRSMEVLINAVSSFEEENMY